MSDLQNMHDNMTGAPVCSGCDKPIYDGTVFKANNRFWHNACLSCVVCHNNVKEYCHMKGNEIFCRSDFIRLFGIKCSGCYKVISPVEAASIANGNAYHVTCLRCTECHAAINTGTCFYMRDDLKLVCQQDFHRLQNQSVSHQTESESDESGSDETFDHQPACLSYDQLHMLDSLYTLKKRPTKTERAELCKQTGLTNRQVQIWFKNRRSKDKRKKPTAANFVHQNGVVHNQSSCTVNTKSTNTNRSCSVQSSTNVQMYCPLDYLEPGSMPPNMELCPSDFINGEVIAGKQNIRQEPHVTSSNYVTNNMMSNWLTA